jgi:ribosomal protein L18E
MRIPKLRGFKNRFKIEYEVVNIGAIGALAEAGAFKLEDDTKKASKSAPITVNQDILRAVGLVRTLNKPMKILGAGEISTPLFVVADAFTASARAKIEAAGGSVNVLEVPKTPLAALGVNPEAEAEAEAAPVAKAPAADKPAKAPKAAKPKAEAAPAAVAETDDETGSEAAGDTDSDTDTDTEAADAAATPADTADAEADEPTAVDETEPASGDDA